jgi:hypothetical protein
MTSEKLASLAIDTTLLDEIVEKDISLDEAVETVQVGYLYSINCDIYPKIIKEDKDLYKLFEYLSTKYLPTTFPKR